jgi:hypothetical protein
MALVGWSVSMAQAGVVYDDPDGGWTYLYTGELVDGDPFEAMDGTWSHENGSDAWDGLPIGDDDSSPGGVASITEDEVTFARFEDTGDPRNEGFPDPSNRKIYVTHDISDDDPDGELLLSGVTLTFRTRLATSGLLDREVPEEGDGYYILDNGKSTFSIRSEFVGVISFAPATASGDDLAENATGALLMNSWDPNGSQSEIDTPDAGEHREFPLDDPTQWNEFWITIQEGEGDNEFNVDIYANGSTTPESFVVSSGDGNDAPGSYIAMGVHSTGQTGAIDIDFFGFKPGIHVPTGGGGLVGDFNDNSVLDVADIDDLTAQSASVTHPAAYDLNGDSLVDAADVSLWVKTLFGSWIGDANLDGEFNSSDLVSVLASGTYEADVASAWSTGDFNGDGRTNSGDLVAALADGGYEAGPAPAIAAVPEPNSLLLTIVGLLGGLKAFRHRMPKPQS